MKIDHDDGERARWVQRYRASGLGLKQFAAEHGLRAGQLQYWVYGIRRSSVAEAETPAFREVKLIGSVATTAPWAAEVVLPNRSVVRLSEGTEPGWASALVEALIRPCSR